MARSQAGKNLNDRVEYLLAQPSVNGLEIAGIQYTKGNKKNGKNKWKLKIIGIFRLAKVIPPSIGMIS